MSESLFQIGCPSCESVFAVTDPELVGQIIACPNCGGMMLVEAAPVARDGKEERIDENERNGADGANVEASGTETDVEAPPSPRSQEASTERNAWNGQNGQNGKDAEDAEDARNETDETEKNAATFEKPRRVGKFVASGIALLVVGAGAFFLTRNSQNDAPSNDEEVVETENGQNSETGEAEEKSRGAAKEEVGGFAPFAVEERTRTNDDGETTNAPSSEIGEIGGVAEENGELENVERNQNAERNAAESSDGENSENAENLQDSEDAGGGAAEETAGNEESAADLTDGDAPEDDVPDDLDGPGGSDGSGDWGELGDLSDLGEEETTGDAENGPEADVEIPSNVEDEAAAGARLAGSNASTGFNEADFERANQNDDPESVDESAEVDWSGVASTTNPTFQGALPTLRRERKEIDVDARLALPIKSIEFPSSPVAAIRVLSEFTGVSIVPDLETFALTRASANATLDLTLHDVTAGEALEKVVALLKWEVYRDKDRLVIRPVGYNPEAVVEERLDVADLSTAAATDGNASNSPGAANATSRLEMFELPNNLTTEALAALIESTVAPESWSVAGGRATLNVEGATLAASQNAQNREKIRVLLEGMRAIRGLPPQSDALPERIAPEKLGWENLRKKTTFAPLTPLALQNAVEILEKSQKFQVFWDDSTLNEAGVGRDATTTVRIEAGTIDAALTEMLAPLNATYLILGEKLIFVTSEEAAENYQTVEFLSLIGENGARPTLEEARDLVAEMKRAVAPESWRTNDVSAEQDAALASVEEDNGNEEIGEIGEGDGDETFGETGGENGVAAIEAIDENSENSENSESGEVASFGNAAAEKSAVVWLDVESSCLIIRQTQPNQRALRRWVEARLANASGTTRSTPKKSAEGEKTTEAEEPTSENESK